LWLSFHHPPKSLLRLIEAPEGRLSRQFQFSFQLGHAMLHLSLRLPGALLVTGQFLNLLPELRRELCMSLALLFSYLFLPFSLLVEYGNYCGQLFFLLPPTRPLSHPTAATNVT